MAAFNPSGERLPASPLLYHTNEGTGMTVDQIWLLSGEMNGGETENQATATLSRGGATAHTLDSRDIGFLVMITGIWRSGEDGWDPDLDPDPDPNPWRWGWLSEDGGALARLGRSGEEDLGNRSHLVAEGGKS